MRGGGGAAPGRAAVEGVAELDVVGQDVPQEGAEVNLQAGGGPKGGGAITGETLHLHQRGGIPATRTKKKAASF